MLRGSNLATLARSIAASFESRQCGKPVGRKQCHVVSRARAQISHSSAVKYLYCRISGYHWILARTKCKDCNMENMAMRNTMNLSKHYLIKFI